MKSLDVVRIIGSLDTRRERDIDLYKEDILGLFPLAVKNKIPLLYLAGVKDLCNNCDELKETYMQLREREKAILSLMKKIVKILSRQNVDYVVFKTLKPFPSIASDIDLLFFTAEGSEKALKAFNSSGYESLSSGFRNSTMLDPRSGIKIDLYSEITVFDIVYMDRSKMREYVTETVIDGVRIPVLTPEADLLVTMGHSFYKEQLYTLADFYSITLHLTQFKSKQRDTFIMLAKEQHVEYACSLLLRLTQKIYSTVFGTEIREITEISNKLLLNLFLSTATCKTLEDFAKKSKLPLKYNYTTVAMGLADKILKDKSTRYSVHYQVKEFLVNRQSLKEFLRRLITRFVRETY